MSPWKIYLRRLIRPEWWIVRKRTYWNWDKVVIVIIPNLTLLIAKERVPFVTKGVGILKMIPTYRINVKRNVSLNIPRVTLINVQEKLPFALMGSGTQEIIS